MHRHSISLFQTSVARHLWLITGCGKHVTFHSPSSSTVAASANPPPNRVQSSSAENLFAVPTPTHWITSAASSSFLVVNNCSSALSTQQSSPCLATAQQLPNGRPPSSLTPSAPTETFRRRVTRAPRCPGELHSTTLIHSVDNTEIDLSSQTTINGVVNEEIEACESVQESIARIYHLREVGVFSRASTARFPGLSSSFITFERWLEGVFTSSSCRAKVQGCTKAVAPECQSRSESCLDEWQ